jgi:nicotinate-nucleotide adenylyltransferase
VGSKTDRIGIGILGGTFDPIHCGHVDLGEAASAALGLTRIEAIVSSVPPHRPQPIASTFHRFAMASLAVASRKGWTASDLELRAEPPSYSSKTLRALHDRGYRAGDLVFIVGADAFAEIETWRDYPAILDAAHFAVVSRPNFPVDRVPDRLPSLAPRMTRATRATSATAGTVIFLIDAPTADVSSTAIRQRRAAGRSIAGLVPPLVEQHIERHGLYAAVDADRRDTGTPVRAPADRLHDQD